jgi:hypothetical protein
MNEADYPHHVPALPAISHKDGFSMSDSRPTAPTSVERMTGGSSRTSGSNGLGGMLTMLLAVACIVLIGACFFIYNAKAEAQKSLAATALELKDAKETLTINQNVMQAKDMKIQQMAAELNRSIPLTRLPEQFKAPTVNEALAKLQQAGEAAVQTAKAGSGSTALPASDSPSAWVETIARTVAKGSFNTKEAAGNDPTKIQMHKGIQIVLTKIGAYNKPISGAPADTYSAVVAFQKANNLQADGVIGKGTWGKVRERMESVAGVHTN